MTLTHQFCFDFYIPLTEDQSLTHSQPERVLAVIEMTVPAKQEIQYGIFLPKRIRDELRRR